MAINALGPYDFPALDRQEVYGDDQLIHVMWAGNMLFCSPACFRVPRKMKWSDFRSMIVDPWASADPDYHPDKVGEWHKDSEPIEPKPDQTLAQLGIAHKGIVSFRMA
jgi:phenol hydroxylase P4 protein